MVCTYNYQDKKELKYSESQLLEGVSASKNAEILVALIKEISSRLC